MATPRDNQDAGDTGSADNVTSAQDHGEEKDSQFTTFASGPSFIDSDQPVIDLVDLPNWLQTLASSMCSANEPENVTDSSEADETQASSTQEYSPGDEETDQHVIELPAWLSAPRDTSMPSNQVDAHGQASGAKMPSGDLDLPGRTEPCSSAENLTISDSDSHHGVNSHESSQLTVPLVARAWVDVPPRNQLTDGGEMFALVAGKAHVSRRQSPAGVEFQIARKTHLQPRDVGHDLQPPSSNSCSIEPWTADRSDSRLPSRRKLYVGAVLAVAVIVLAALLALLAF